jgi:hypothetical protein
MHIAEATLTEPSSSWTVDNVLHAMLKGLKGLSYSCIFLC